MTNQCDVCLHSWSKIQQDRDNGYCYMWRVEPANCTHPHFKVDCYKTAEKRRLAERATQTVDVGK